MTALNAEGGNSLPNRDSAALPNVDQPEGAALPHAKSAKLAACFGGADKLHAISIKYAESPETLTLLEVLAHNYPASHKNLWSDIGAVLNSEHGAKAAAITEVLRRAAFIEDTETINAFFGVLHSCQHIATEVFAAPATRGAEVIELLGRILMKENREYFKPSSFELYEVVRQCSKHESWDIEQLLKAQRAKEKITVEALRDFYARGYRYIHSTTDIVSTGSHGTPELCDATGLARLSSSGHYHDMEITFKAQQAILRLFALEKSERPPETATMLVEHIAYVDLQTALALLRLSEREIAAEQKISKMIELLLLTTPHRLRLGFQSLLQKVAEYDLKDIPEAAKLLKAIVEEHPNNLHRWHTLVERRELGEIDRLLREDRHERYHQRPAAAKLAQVLELWERASQQQRSAMPPGRLAVAAMRAQECNQTTTALLDLHTPQLRERLAQLRFGRTPIDSEEGMIEWFALTREAYRRATGKFPTDAQMLMALFLADDASTATERAAGAYARLQSNEDRAVVLALFASYRVVRGEKVDILARTREGAQAVVQQSRQFFDLLSMPMVYTANHAPGLSERDDSIQVTTLESLTSQMMHELVYLPPVVPVRKPETAIMADYEVSEVVSHEQSIQIPARFSANQLRAIATYVEQGGWRYPEEISALTAASCQAENPALEDVSLDLLQQYLRGAVQALHLAEGVNYAVSKREGIVPLDEANGRALMYGRVWSDPITSFLAMRHSLPIPKTWGDVGSITSATYLRRYKRLFGVFGTLGEQVEHHHLRSNYNLVGITAPTTAPHVSTKPQTTVFEQVASANRYIAQIAAEVTRGRAPRPLLILANSPARAKDLRRYLEAQGLLCHLLIEGACHGPGEKPMRASDLVTDARLPGSITIATPAELSPERIPVYEAAREAGGIHTVLTWLPLSLRSEEIMAVKAGAGDASGSFEIVVHAADDHFLRHISKEQRDLVIETIGAFGPSSDEFAAAYGFIRCAQEIQKIAEGAVLIKRDSLLQMAQGRLREWMETTRTELADRHSSKNGLLARSVATTYIRRAWQPLYERLRAELNHSGEGKTAPSFVPVSENSKLQDAILNAFEQAFHLPLDEMRAVSPQGMQRQQVQLCESVLDAVCETERRAAALEADSFEKLIDRLDMELARASRECIERFDGAGPGELERYIHQWP
jgi:preprotein translocase subunit SecA